MDVISNGYALMYGIADEQRATEILENYPMVTLWRYYSLATKNGVKASYIYHNRGVWPGWEATLMMGAKQRGHLQLADAIWKSQIRGAGTDLTNIEVTHYETGLGLLSQRQLWSVAGTLSGYYRVLYGMEYDVDGIRFAPYVPDWLDGPFEVSRYTYRDSILTLKLTGKGDTLVSLKVDGEEKPLDYVFPTDSTGEHLIEMVVEDSGRRDPINIKPISWVVCPDLPVMNYDDATNTLSWNPDSRYTYKLWNGREYIDVTGKNSYPTVEGEYGVYSLVSVDSEGVTSEMSKPIQVNTSENIFTYEAEDQEYNSGNFASSVADYTGTGYVVDTMTNHTSITTTVNIPKGKAGEYQFNAVYHNQGNATTTTHCAIRSVYVDGQDVGTMVFPLSNFNFDRSTYTNLNLTEGEHKITIKYDDANWYDRNMNPTRNNVSYDSFKLEYLGARAPVAPEDLDTSLLEFMIKEADKQVEDGALVGVIEVVVENFNRALKEAKAMLVKADVDPSSVAQAEIDLATKNLIDVLHLLDFKANKDLLQNLVALSNKYVADKALYRPATYTPFETALADAKAVLADGSAFQDEIDAAWFALANGVANLRKIPNKDALKGLLDKARSIDSSQYTVASFAMLVDAADDANLVYDDKNSSEAAVDSSEKAMKTALSGLVPLGATTTDGTDADVTTTTKASDSDEVIKVADTTTKAVTSAPKTGENSLFGLLFIVLSLSCVVVVAIRKKKVK